MAKKRRKAKAKSTKTTRTLQVVTVNARKKRRGKRKSRAAAKPAARKKRSSSPRRKRRAAPSSSAGRFAVSAGVRDARLLLDSFVGGLRRQVKQSIERRGVRYVFRRWSGDQAAAHRIKDGLARRLVYMAGRKRKPLRPSSLRIVRL